MGFLASLVRRYLVSAGSQEGYGAFVSLIGILMIMPIGLLVSSVAFAVWKRRWLFFVLAVVVAAATALAPVISM